MYICIQMFNHFLLCSVHVNFASAVESKNETEDTDKNTPLPLPVKKEKSTPTKEKLGEVKSSEKSDEAENGDNVIIEELSSPGVDLESDELFDEELQPTEGTF